MDKPVSRRIVGYPITPYPLRRLRWLSLIRRGSLCSGQDAALKSIAEMQPLWEDILSGNWLNFSL